MNRQEMMIKYNRLSACLKEYPGNAELAECYQELRNLLQNNSLRDRNNQYSGRRLNENHYAGNSYSQETLGILMAGDLQNTSSPDASVALQIAEILNRADKICDSLSDVSNK